MNELTDIEKGYIAGFLDGEGEISVNSSYTCFVRFNNTNMEVLKWIQEKLGTGRIGETHRIRKPNHKQCYSLWIHGEETKILLQYFFPYLIIKKKQAELILSYPTGFHNKQVISSVRQKREGIIRELRTLNKRGVSYPLS